MAAAPARTRFPQPTRCPIIILLLSTLAGDRTICYLQLVHQLLRITEPPSVYYLKQEGRREEMSEVNFFPMAISLSGPKECSESPNRMNRLHPSQMKNLELGTTSAKERDQRRSWSTSTSASKKLTLTVMKMIFPCKSMQN